MEAAGDALIASRIGQKVPGQLLNGEPVECHVVVERLDHPFTPEPHEARAIEMIAAGIGVAGQVEPHLGHALAVLRSGQQSVHHFLVSIRIFVGQKRVHFSHRWRQTRQVQADAAQQGRFVRFRRRL